MVITDHASCFILICRLLAKASSISTFVYTNMTVQPQTKGFILHRNAGLSNTNIETIAVTERRRHLLLYWVYELGRCDTRGPPVICDTGRRKPRKRSRLKQRCREVGGGDTYHLIYHKSHVILDLTVRYLPHISVDCNTWSVDGQKQAMPQFYGKVKHFRLKSTISVKHRSSHCNKEMWPTT